MYKKTEMDNEDIPNIKLAFWSDSDEDIRALDIRITWPVKDYELEVLMECLNVLKEKQQEGE